VLTEVANNVRQHSGGQGYASAQVQRAMGLVQLAIVDTGKGVRQSFVDAGLPWSKSIDDLGALRKALEPRISSKGKPSNEGVGLSLTVELARQSGAWLLVASGRGAVCLTPNLELKTAAVPDGRSVQGTLVAMTFKQENVLDFAALLQSAKLKLGLLLSNFNEGRFGS
jgi:hypothetical protein